MSVIHLFTMSALLFRITNDVVLASQWSFLQHSSHFHILSFHFSLLLPVIFCLEITTQPFWEFQRGFIKKNFLVSVINHFYGVSCSSESSHYSHFCHFVELCHRFLIVTFPFIYSHRSNIHTMNVKVTLDLHVDIGSGLSCLELVNLTNIYYGRYLPGDSKANKFPDLTEPIFSKGNGQQKNK